MLGSSSPLSGFPGAFSTKECCFTNNVSARPDVSRFATNDVPARFISAAHVARVIATASVCQTPLSANKKSRSIIIISLTQPPRRVPEIRRSAQIKWSQSAAFLERTGPQIPHAVLRAALRWVLIEPL
jgi:hypothetical protein